MDSKIPNADQINSYLEEASKLNPGPWVEHSLYVGMAAKLIAERCDDLDEELAYAMGALHDIGRREGVKQMHHTLDGYHFMMQEGYPDIARVCLTHSFFTKCTIDNCSKPDCTPEEIEFIDNYLNTIKFDDYDLLIQLCDSLATSEGYCLLEKRMIDVARRYDINKGTRKRWKKQFELFEYFNGKTGVSVYSLLPNIAETTFGCEV